LKKCGFDQFLIKGRAQGGDPKEMDWTAGFAAWQGT